MKNKEKWYVIYTKSRQEKVLAERLQGMGYEVYIPLVKEQSKRTDRKTTFEKPLFNSYIFIKETIDLEPLRIFSGFVAYLQYNGKPAIVYQYEIDIIKSLIKHGYNVELTELDINQLNEGRKVMVINGPLKGMEGEVYQLINQEFVYVHFESFQGSMKINISYKQLKLL